LGFGVRPPEAGQSRPEREVDTHEADVILSHPREPGGHPVDTPLEELGHIGAAAESHDTTEAGDHDDRGEGDR
jgi:hypothetical protein